MGRKAVDLSGQKFGRLTVIERVENKGNNSAWLCKCLCGKTKVVVACSLKSGRTTSCGCFGNETKSKTGKANTKHGMCGTRIYKIWDGMLGRCRNPTDKDYHRYGGRGIKVCDEWQSDFQSFYNWAMSHGYSDDLTIDRINVNGDYSPDNCKWSTIKEQNNNKRNNRYVTYKGKTQTLKQWSDELGLCYPTVLTRVNKLGWTIEKALSTP